MLSICDPEVDALKKQAQSVILWDAKGLLLRVPKTRVLPGQGSPLAFWDEQDPFIVSPKPMIKHPFLRSSCPLHQNNPFVSASIDTPSTRLALTNPNTVIMRSPVSQRCRVSSRTSMSFASCGNVQPRSTAAAVMFFPTICASGLITFFSFLSHLTPL